MEFHKKQAFLNKIWNVIFNECFYVYEDMPKAKNIASKSLEMIEKITEPINIPEYKLINNLPDYITTENIGYNKAIDDFKKLNNI